MNILFFGDMISLYIAQVDVELKILLPLPPGGWDYGHVSSHWAYKVLFFFFLSGIGV
jgi:hypothetical protein